MADDTKRVLIIAPTPFFADRGCHVHIAEQAWALQRQGKEVLIVTYGIGRDVPNLTTRRTWRFPWYKREAMGPSLHKLYIDVFLLFTALHAAWRMKPHVIHAHLHEGCLIGWVVGKILNIPMIFDCQGSLTGELLAHNFILTRGQWMHSAWYALEGWLDRRPAMILAQSREMQRELTGRFNVPKNRIIMACDGVNTHTFQPGQGAANLIERLKIPSNHKVIVYLGGLAPHKGVDTLLDAFALVLRTMPDTTLLLMGYPNEARYRQHARELGVGKHVRITGRIRYEDAPRYIIIGDVAVAPKRTQTEANGKIYHYMACGLPTIAFDTVVNRDILGELGIYARPETDAQGLAEAIGKFLSNAQIHQQLAAQLRRKAVRHYSWDAVARRIDQAYQLAATPWQLHVFSVSVRKKEKWQWSYPHLTALLASSTTKRCLDVGSGVGTLSRLMEQLGGSWTFTETDTAAAAETQNIVRGPVKTINIFDQSLNEGSYDLITIFDVIEHVPDPRAFLARAQQLLAPGGTIMLTTPAADNKKYWWRWVADRLFGIDRTAHGHVVDGFSRQELENMCTKAGLEIQQASTFSHFFTEMVELMYNGAYILKNRRRQRTGGYNLALSPASGSDVHHNSRQLVFLRMIYPVLRGVSLLDRFLPGKHGYEWGLVARKKNTASSTATNSSHVISPAGIKLNVALATQKEHISIQANR